MKVSRESTEQGRGLKRELRTSVPGVATEEGGSSVKTLIDEGVGGRNFGHEGVDAELVTQTFESHVSRVGSLFERS